MLSYRFGISKTKIYGPMASLRNGRNVCGCRFNAFYKTQNVYAHYAHVPAEP